MIFVTGDTHGRYDSDKLYEYETWAHGCTLTKSDYLIIAGDFGYIWNEEELDQLRTLSEELPYTILFIDGNHENFTLLNAYPISEWNGGKVHMIADDIIHLMRGQVFTIEGKKIFTMGGAVSIDKIFRVEGKSWWPEEVPTREEFEEAYDNLDRVGNAVDFIITHTIDEITLTQWPMSVYQFQAFGVDENLNNIEETVEYGLWIFGHYHIDVEVNKKKRAIYNDVIRLT